MTESTLFRSVSLYEAVGVDSYFSAFEEEYLSLFSVNFLFIFKTHIKNLLLSDRGKDGKGCIIFVKI